MWAKLFRAEFYKIIGNRWATGCMIWIFPAAAVLLICFLLFLMLFPSPRASFARGENSWTGAMLVPWVIPNNPIGRLLLLGFTAVLFGGEYQWNTWKSIVPRSWRIPLILTKFLAVALFVVFAFTLMSVILGVGMGLVALAAGGSYGPAINGEVLRDFAEDYALQASTAFISTIIAAGYAALAAMITRSILGSAIVGVIVSIAETFTFLPLALLAWLLDFDGIVHLYRFIPFYNLTNVTTWLFDTEPLTLEVGDRIVTDSLEFSLVVLACWVVGLITLTAYLFQRQDVTN